MNEIVGVSINNSNNIDYYYVKNLKLKKNLTVVVETETGLRFGKVVSDIHPINNNELNKKLYSVKRIATKKDYDQNQKNIKDSNKALENCKKISKEYHLDMKIIDAYYTHDREQLIFKFLSDSRIDFRNLAKDLANIYHTRIELRQVGVRDKAKEIGGIGSCGQCLCCSRFLKEFDSVSISMAKNQNISLNPSKINGLCGRLLCCLKYEDECYKECKKELPKVGQIIKTKDGKEGKVISVDILKQKYKIDSDREIIEEILDGSN